MDPSVPILRVVPPMFWNTDVMHYQVVAPRPYFMEPLPVTTELSPIRAPSPCEECPNGIKRSGSCHDCLNMNSPHPPTPVAVEDLSLIHI